MMKFFSRTISRRLIWLSVVFVGGFASASILGANVEGSVDLTLGIDQSAAPKRDDCTIAGWSRDPANINSSRVDFYMNAPYGQAGAVFVGAVIANLYRGDLPFGDKNHGYSYAFPRLLPGGGNNPIWDGVNHRIYAYGIKVSSATSTAMLQGSGANIKCPTNVLLYGAQGNGIADDSGAIDNAIGVSGSNSLIYFPSGVYNLLTAHGTMGWNYVDIPLAMGLPSTQFLNALRVVKSYVTLAGQLTGSTKQSILKLAPNTKMRILGIGLDDSGKYCSSPIIPSPPPSSGCTSSAISSIPSGSFGNNSLVRDLVFDGNSSNRTAATWPAGDVVDALVLVDRSSFNQFSNIEIRNGLEDGLGCWRCRNLRAENSHFHDLGVPTAGAAGITLSVADNAIVVNNQLASNINGIWVHHGSKSVQIINNTIADNSYLGLALGGSLSPENSDNTIFTITGNTILRNGLIGFQGNKGGAAAISLVTTPGAPIMNAFSGNILNGNWGGINVHSSYNWNIQNNLIVGTGAMYQVGVGISGGGTFRVRANSIENYFEGVRISEGASDVVFGLDWSEPITNLGGNSISMATVSGQPARWGGLFAR